MAKTVKINGSRALVYDDGALADVRRLPQSAPQSAPQSQAPDLDSLKALDLVAFNQAAERLAVEIMHELAAEGGVTVREVRAELAYRLNVSAETAKRYIEKYAVARSAPLCVRGGVLCLREVRDDAP